MFRNWCFYKNKAKEFKKIKRHFTSLQIIDNNAQSAEFYKLIQKNGYCIRIKMMHG
jgi:Iap family predicted aminopeptidase